MLSDKYIMFKVSMYSSNAYGAASHYALKRAYGKAENRGE